MDEIHNQSAEDEIHNNSCNGLKSKTTAAMDEIHNQSAEDEIHNNSCNDNLQWIEIHRRDISRPYGTYKPAKSQRLGRYHTDRFQSIHYQKYAEGTKQRASGSTDLFKNLLSAMITAMDNLQWIEIHRRDISRPDGTS